jgi:hypothetical protein
MGRNTVWFSCGAASAVTAKLAPADATGKPIAIIGSKRYVTVDDVFESTRYMSGVKGARCTVEMKKVPRFAFQQPDDTHLFGLTADEGKRIERFEANNPELKLRWLLRDSGITKNDCYEIIKGAGIALPVMYSKGFKNNNCKGCVKATSPAYWGLTRKHFPETFTLRAIQSRTLGVRLCRYKGERIYLDELPMAIDDQTPQEDIECGPICINEAVS